MVIVLVVCATSRGIAGAEVPPIVLGMQEVLLKVGVMPRRVHWAYHGL